jgi:hypothetical protein
VIRYSTVLTVRDSVPDLKIVANNPNAALTATAQTKQDLRVPAVYGLKRIVS